MAAEPIKNRIVVGVDGSQVSHRALVWALRQARLTGATVEAVNVWKLPNDFGMGYTGMETTEFEEVAREDLRKALAEAGEEADGVEVVEEVCEGSPGPALAHLGEGATLLVVGPTGHGELAGVLLGSVSEYLTTHAPCTVVVVREPAI